MRRLCFIASLIVLILATASPSLAAVKQWRVDPAHSYVGFKVHHMMVNWIRGRFNDVDGKVWYDPADPSSTKVEVEIDAASINTQNERRDDHLRNEDFFYVEKYPKLRFVSKSVKGNTQTGFQLVGDLTMRGVTKEVTLDVKGLQRVISNGKGGERMGLNAVGKVNRNEFGLTWVEPVLGGGVNVADEVILEIDAELIWSAPEAAK
jgi:polyisoprenoid-binding protein YceI